MNKQACDRSKCGVERIHVLLILDFSGLLGLDAWLYLHFTSSKSLIIPVITYGHICFGSILRWIPWCSLFFSQSHGGQDSLSNHCIERLGQRIICHLVSCQRASSQAADCLRGNIPWCGTSVFSEVVEGFPDAAQH